MVKRLIIQTIWLVVLVGLWLPSHAADLTAEPDKDRDVFIELSADKAEAYVQEQMILTVRLFFRDNLIRGELSEPKHPDIAIEPLGKQRETSRYKDGLRYRVIERRYALFPQEPGTLSLSPVRFKGQARNTDGSLKRLQDSAQLFDIAVKDIPAEFSGSTWLPATELSLNESGMPPTLNLETGDNLTRTLTLKATGLPSEALPPLSESAPDGLRSYPEEPRRNTDISADGMTSALSQTSALVPVEAGKLTLPAIRVLWWDTDSDSEKVAIIPAQTLNVANAQGATDSTAAMEENQKPEPEAADKDKADATIAGSFWQWVSLALAGVWILTMLAWWQTRRMQPRAPADHGTTAADNEKRVFEQLLNAARDGSASAPALYVDWANLRLPGHNFRSIGEVNRTVPEPEVSAELSRLQAHLFSRNGEVETWRGSALADALKKARNRTANRSSEAGLPPLYPSTLSASGEA